MMRNILILFLVSGVMANAGFSRQGDIVTDSISKLQWQDDKIGKEMGWKDAIDHCEALNLGGYSDWRLPNLNELKSIVNRDKYNPAFKNMSPGVTTSEATGATVAIDFLSNGFKQKGSTASYANRSGHLYVYAAWAENPFVTSAGVPTTAK